MEESGRGREHGIKMRKIERVRESGGGSAGEKEWEREREQERE